MTIIINDLHLGVQRTGGTTPQSAQDLRDHQGRSLLGFVRRMGGENHLIVNGDLFDRFEITASDVVDAHVLFADWLHDENCTLTLCAGNHDWNPRGNKLSSFHLLCHFLQAQFGDRVTVCDTGLEQIKDGIWCIPHMPNQDLFALEIEKACATKHEGEYLLLHCNVKNTFAEHSDTSLNLTDDLLAKLMIAGWILVVGHEHQGYTLRGGRVIVVGNQWPTSVADCIGEKSKNALVITETSCFTVPTWQAEGNYAEIDWRDIAEHAGDEKFIRVTGDATSAESADVIAVISRFRQKSDAYVISNAVKVDGVAALDDLAADAIGDVKAFDVLGTIMEHLDEKQQQTVKELLA